MANFPIFESLDITGYGLYPGSGDGNVGLHIDFRAGLTLVLGANGLGKTTLVNILYRLLSGPYDVSGISSGQSELGSPDLTPTQIKPEARKAFANRVVDDAREATACLMFKLGQHTVTVERHLSDLRLIRFEIDGRTLNPDEQKVFHPEIAKLVGVWSFGDWILLLRLLVFYFEDRRALVWDRTAQRQILRTLFLATDVAAEWVRRENEIRTLDSGMRTQRSGLNRLERERAADEQRVLGAGEVKAKIKALENKRVDLSEALDRLESESLEVEEAREDARRRVLTVEQEREARYREVERAKLRAIGASFPSRSDTARYIIAQLMTHEECLVCGNYVPEAEQVYLTRVEQEQCVVCGSELREEHFSDGLVSNTIADAVTGLKQIDREYKEANLAFEKSKSEFNAHEERIRKLKAEQGECSREVEKLISHLPPDEQDFYKQKSMLELMREEVARLENRVNQKRHEFMEFVGSIRLDIARSSQSVKTSFDQYAQDFLLEQCRLTFSMQKSRVGQTGEPIEFPAFEVDMSGGDFSSLVRRSGPEQVSESQREFIDLAFRMALITVAGGTGSGSLVIDAPESSLDAVFTERAARTLAGFASATPDNRLFVASNLIEGDLLPELISASRLGSEQEPQVVNLVSLAAPTAAVEKLRSSYQEVFNRIMENART